MSTTNSIRRAEDDKAGVGVGLCSGACRGDSVSGGELGGSEPSDTEDSWLEVVLESTIPKSWRCIGESIGST